MASRTRTRRFSPPVWGRWSKETIGGRDTLGLLKASVSDAEYLVNLLDVFFSSEMIFPICKLFALVALFSPARATPTRRERLPCRLSSDTVGKWKHVFFFFFFV